MCINASSSSSVGIEWQGNKYIAFGVALQSCTVCYIERL